MTSPTNRPKRAFFPRRSFDEDLRDFVRLANRQGWQISGVDLEQLAQDANAQFEERARINEAESRLKVELEEFARAQEQRYRRFATAVKAARAAFRDDECIGAWLNRFKYSNGSADRATQRQITMGRDGRRWH